MGFQDEVVAVVIAIVIGDLFMIALKETFKQMTAARFRCRDPHCTQCRKR